ncbi:hypothetical protein KC19_10G126100 [Ceratodon purpureus]|uniref:Tify domain-containing protein n=1 Tax=Ceratodon purpureus TaxID=3225 RepID=A0A8T0GJS2_CERPU|nr:hypothetical protein KC19_10G126100 [Ceratodon purpureus]
MKGDGEDNGLRDFLSLGSSSMSSGSRSTGSRSYRSGEREGFSGRAGTSTGDESLELNLTMLSRDGLNMLAGSSHGGFTLKPPPVGNLSGMPSLRNLALGAGGERTSGKVAGGGFTGFYRASLPKTTWPSSPAGMGMLFVNEEVQVKGEAGASSSHREGSGSDAKLEQPSRTDVENLTPEECWSLVLKLGKRWPGWNRTTALQSPQGVMKDRSSLIEALDLDHHSQRLSGNPEISLGQDTLKLLTSRALEALAQTPDRYGRPAGIMLAPKLTTQQFSKTRAARDLPVLISQSADPRIAVSRQTPLSDKPPTSSGVMAAPTISSAGRRTAPLTIFYDGKVNVCDNVPEDKAHFIMLFAERSNVNPNAQAPGPSASCAAPSTSTSPEITPGSVLAHQESARPQAPQPSSNPVVVTVPSLVPSHLAPGNHSEGSSSHQKPTKCSNLAEVTNAAPPAMPFRVVPATEGSSRQLLQQCLNGPSSKRLPNARKNSLARFLDSRKRPNASSPEDQPSKKQELGASSDACPSDANDTDGRGKSHMPLCSQSSIDSKEGITAIFTNDAEMIPNDSLMK